jgi:RNA polymerase-binding transcription factor DksA
MDSGAMECGAGGVSAIHHPGDPSLQPSVTNFEENCFMDQKRLQYFTKKILDERDRIVASLSHHEVEFASATSSRSAEFEEASRLDKDREYISGLLTMDTEELADINESLKRILDGTYGKCVDCGNDIPEARLDAMPSTLRCLDCQRQNEMRQEFDAEEPPPTPLL